MTVETPPLSLIIPIAPGDHSWRALLVQLGRLCKEIEWAPNIQVILSARETLDVPVAIRQLFSDLVVIEKPIESLIERAGSAGEAPAPVNARAFQLNNGVQGATGEYLWFLHADSEIDKPGLLQLFRFIEKEQGRVMAFFWLEFASDGPSFTRLNAWGANLRSRLFLLPFGDQGFLMSKTVWRDVGRYDESLLMGEDLDWVVRARMQGVSLRALPAKIKTSARKYQRYGWLNVTLRHWVATIGLARAAKSRFENKQT